jgi:hypothetical protein
MKRTRPLPVVAAAAALAAAFLCLSAPPAHASARGDWWRGQAVTALTRFIAADAGTGDSFTYGMATGAAGYLYGWTDTRTVHLLAELRGTKLAGGSYGLGRPYDAFADGTINPADTAYAVTLAGHVGPTLLAGYKAGAVPKAEVQAVVNQLVAMPRVPVDRGQCVAYSDDPNDDPPLNPAYPIGCAHNVNAGTGWFLSDANAAGFGATGMQKLITDITLAEIVAFREADNTWPYIDDGPFLDADHDSYEAESMYRLAYWIGRESTFRWMANPPPPGEAKGPIIHTRLAGSPGGNGSFSRTDPGVVLWCQMADRWQDEQAEYQATQTGASLAQFAYYAARASKNCA